MVPERVCRIIDEAIQIHGATGVSHGQGFADAQNDVDPRLVRRHRFGRDIGIGFAPRLASFAMTCDDPGRAGFGQHVGR